MRHYLAAALAITTSSLWATQAVAADTELSAVIAPATEIATEAAVVSAAASAASTSLEMDEPAAGGSDWEVAFTPYLWIAGMKGDIGIPRGDGVEIDTSFADILGNLKFAFMGAIDVRKDRFVMLGDIIYLSVGADVKGIQDPQFVEGEVDSSVFVSTAALGYRVVDQGPMFVDLVAGARIVSLKAKVELTGPLATRVRDESKSNVAGLVGGRVRVPLGKNWGAALYGDVGTGSVKWQMVGTIQWDISEHWRMSAGYRHLSINHDKENFNFDIALSGPILGFSYRF